MLQNIYAVRDEKVQSFLKPFFIQTNGAAIRAFQDASRDPKTALYAHPEDYVLYLVGTFDDESAVFTSVSPVQFLARASEFSNPVMPEAPAGVAQ